MSPVKDSDDIIPSSRLGAGMGFVVAEKDRAFAVAAVAYNSRSVFFAHTYIEACSSTGAAFDFDCVIHCSDLVGSWDGV